MEKKREKTLQSLQGEAKADLLKRITLAWPHHNKTLKGMTVRDLPAFEIKDKMLRIDGFIALGPSSTVDFVDWMGSC